MSLYKENVIKMFKEVAEIERVRGKNGFKPESLRDFARFHNSSKNAPFVCSAMLGSAAHQILVASTFSSSTPHSLTKINQRLNLFAQRGESFDIRLIAFPDRGLTDVDSKLQSKLETMFAEKIRFANFASPASLFVIDNRSTRVSGNWDEMKAVVSPFSPTDAKRAKDKFDDVWKNLGKAHSVKANTYPVASQRQGSSSLSEKVCEPVA